MSKHCTLTTHTLPRKGRCMECYRAYQAAWYAANREEKAAKQAAHHGERAASARTRNDVTRGRSSHGNNWTLADWSIACDPSMTSPEAAVLLNRSISAVRNVRRRQRLSERKDAA